MENQNFQEYDYNEYPVYEPYTTTTCEICGQTVELYGYVRNVDDYALSGVCQNCGEEYET